MSSRNIPGAAAGVSDTAKKKKTHSKSHESRKGRKHKANPIWDLTLSSTTKKKVQGTKPKSNVYAHKTQGVSYTHKNENFLQHNFPKHQTLPDNTLKRGRYHPPKKQ